MQREQTTAKHEHRRIPVIFTTCWNSPQSCRPWSVDLPAYPEGTITNTIHCDIPRHSPIHKGGHGRWSMVDANSSTDPGLWRVYLCRTESFGPAGWLSGLLEIESGATFEDLELKYPDIATYHDLAIHVKLPIELTPGALEITVMPSRVLHSSEARLICAKTQLSVSSINTTMHASDLHARIKSILGCGTIEAKQLEELSVRVNLRVTHPDTGRSREVVLPNTSASIGASVQLLPFELRGSPVVIDAIVEPTCMASAAKLGGLLPLLCLGKAKNDKKKGRGIAGRLKHTTVDEAINATKRKLELLEAIQAANKIKTELNEKVAWIQGMASSDLQYLVKEYLA
jgi:hypothetical protein